MYTAGWNTPGYLPDTDSELPTFETAADAWHYLRDEYLYASELNDPDPDTLADFDVAVRSGLTGNVATDGVVYWVSEAEEDEPVSTAEDERAAEWLRALHEAGYTDLDVLHTRQGPISPGSRVRIASGDGTVLHLTERKASPWATSWGSRDIEIILRMDSGRTAQVAQYHLHRVYESGE